MKYIVKDSYEEVSKVAAEIFIEQIKNKPNSVLGFATGSTPIGLYNNLLKAYEDGEISFKDIKSYNLDEYVGISPQNESSYRYFMEENLFSKVDIKKENAHVPESKTDGIEDIAINYEKELEEIGYVDLQVLGVGENGHIAFNEPDSELSSTTHIVKLTEDTRRVNSRFFNSIDEVPTHAITMGMGTILKAKKIILIATGEKKKPVIEKLLKDDLISSKFPVSFLKCHRDVTIICDKEAGI